MILNKVLLSTRQVAKKSTHVNLNTNQLYKFCDELEPLSFLHWLHDSPFDLFSLSFTDRLHFITVLDAISFCYWPEPKWYNCYKGIHYDGTKALICSIGNAVENGYPITDFKYLSNMKLSDFEDIFETNCSMPLKLERLKILNEIGKVISDRFAGNFEHVIKLAERNALSLTSLIVDIFPGFNDISSYKGMTVYFYKRAQLLTADIHHLFNDTFSFKNISELTACADYKLPQVLRQKGILEYSSILSATIDNREPIQANSDQEIEIRANTIWAVEEIKSNLQKKGMQTNSNQINDYLWLESQKKHCFDKPYHQTLTTFY